MAEVKAIWGHDFDDFSGKQYKCPVCHDCKEPISVNGKCISCGNTAILDDEMKHWFEIRTGIRYEFWDCMNCGEKKMYVRMRKNRRTRDWEAASGKCENCGCIFIV